MPRWTNAVRDTTQLCVAQNKTPGWYFKTLQDLIQSSTDIEEMRGDSHLKSLKREWKTTGLFTDQLFSKE